MFPGINVGASGPTSVRLRPALIFQHHHADIFLDAFDSVLHNNNWALTSVSQCQWQKLCSTFIDTCDAVLRDNILSVSGSIYKCHWQLDVDTMTMRWWRQWRQGQIHVSCWLQQIHGIVSRTWPVAFIMALLLSNVGNLYFNIENVIIQLNSEELCVWVSVQMMIQEMCSLTIPVLRFQYKKYVMFYCCLYSVIIYLRAILYLLLFTAYFFFVYCYGMFQFIVVFFNVSLYLTNLSTML